jgi:hypothetical protein
LRLPRTLAGRTGFETPQNALEYELAQEMASTLGRLGRQLEAALGALAAFDAEHPKQVERTAQDRRMRSGLVGAAGVALWNFVVQRESIGLRDSQRVMREYRVPDEVRNRMGPFP